MVTFHPHYPEIVAADDGKPVRYFIRSHAFRKLFTGVTPEIAYSLVERNPTRRKRGPVFDASDVLTNTNGEWWRISTRELLQLSRADDLRLIHGNKTENRCHLMPSPFVELIPRDIRKIWSMP